MLNMALLTLNMALLKRKPVLLTFKLALPVVCMLWMLNDVFHTANIIMMFDWTNDKPKHLLYSRV